MSFDNFICATIYAGHIDNWHQVNAFFKSGHQSRFRISYDLLTAQMLIDLQHANSDHCYLSITNPSMQNDIIRCVLCELAVRV